MKLTKEFLTEMMLGKQVLEDMGGGIGWVALDCLAISLHGNIMTLRLMKGTTVVATQDAVVDLANGGNLYITTDDTGFTMRLHVTVGP